MKWKSPHGRALPLGNGVPIIMGILNVSKDSFSDGGKYLDGEAALRRVRQMVAEGVNIVDVGAESTRPGAIELDADAELGLLMDKLVSVRKKFPDLPLSVDTYKPEVARAAIGAGADIVNDVRTELSGAGYPMARLCAEISCPLVATHNCRGANFDADNFLDEMESLLTLSLSEGIDKNMLVLDPGVGFGKTPQQNAAIVRDLNKLRELDCAVLLGVSRKSMFAEIVGDDFSDRDDATAAVSAMVTFFGSADILRVHDVRKNLNAVKTAYKLRWTK